MNLYEVLEKRSKKDLGDFDVTDTKNADTIFAYVCYEDIQEENIENSGIEEVLIFCKYLSLNVEVTENQDIFGDIIQADFYGFVEKNLDKFKKINDILFAEKMSKFDFVDFIADLVIGNYGDKTYQVVLKELFEV